MTTATAYQTADGEPIKVGDRVYVWDDLPAVPTLDRYQVKSLAGPADGTIGLSGSGRLRFAMPDQCYRGGQAAVRDGFRDAVTALAEERDTFGNPHKVMPRGVCLMYQGKPAWFGQGETLLTPFIGHDVLIGRHDPARPRHAAVYDLGGEFIAIVSVNDESSITESI